MPVPRRRHTLIMAILVLGMTMNLHKTAGAETSTTTEVIVQTVSAGEFDVHWDTSSTRFVTSDGDNPSVTATQSTVAHATFPLVINDTRADGERPGYTISISAGAFGIAGSHYAIPADQLAITGLSGLPEGYDTSSSVGNPLDTAVTILTVENAAPALSDTTITVTLRMEIPAGMPPGAYTGEITVGVMPLTAAQ